MAIIRCQVRWRWDSGSPSDVSVNTFHYTTIDPFTSTIGDDIRDDLATSYALIDQLCPDALLAQTVDVRMYNLADSEPREPVYVSTFTLSPVSGSPLPPEVALCLSFQGDQTSGVSQARRRGRVYIGPILQSAGGSDGRPAAGTITSFVAFGQSLLDLSDASSNYVWVVRSEAGGFTSPVTNGWVDNEWDTQRRRGRDSTSRTTFS